MSEVKTMADQIRFLANLLVNNPTDERALGELALIAKRTNVEVDYRLPCVKGPEGYHLTYMNGDKKIAWTEESTRRPSHYVNWYPLGICYDLNVAKAVGAAIIECALFVEANNPNGVVRP